MRHFLVYHYPKGLPYPVTQIPTLDAYSSKPANEVLNARVWVVGGIEKPRVYYLGSTFVCTRLGTGTPTYGTKMSGVEGHIFGNRVIIVKEPWFEILKKSTGHFAFGLTEITDGQVIKGLVDAAKTDDYVVVP